jgi:LysM repeat protein
MLYSHKKFELSPRLRLGVGRGYSQNQILKISGILCLVLALGLAFNAVRLMFTETSSEQAGAPQVLGATDVKIQTAATEVQFIEYKIQKGDTLFNVAQKYNISWTTLATLNNLKSPFTLKPGETLRIPK